MSIFTPLEKRIEKYGENKINPVYISCNIIFKKLIEKN
jgi:hypothetical protein